MRRSSRAGDDLPALPPIQRELTLSGVALSYNAERRSLDGVDVQIPAGSRVAFVGPSGSGKSSILRVLMRLYEPDEGTIRLDGIDVSTRSLESLRAQMGVVFQDSFLFNATIRENIAMGKPWAPRKPRFSLQPRRPKSTRSSQRCPEGTTRW